MQRRTLAAAAGGALVAALYLLDGPLWMLSAPGGIDPAVRSAMGRLRSWRGSTRARAATDLQILGPAAAPAAPALVDHLDDFGWADFREGLSKFTSFHGGPSFVCNHAAGALVAIGPAAIPALIAGMENPRERVRIFAVDILSRTGDSRALPPLRNAVLRDPSDSVQNAAARELGRLHDRAVFDELALRLHDPNPRRRAMAILLLESLDVPEAVPLVRQTLQDPVANVREMADVVLRRMEAAR